MKIKYFLDHNITVNPLLFGCGSLTATLSHKPKMLVCYENLIQFLKTVQSIIIPYENVSQGGDSQVCGSCQVPKAEVV